MSSETHSRQLPVIKSPLVIAVGILCVIVLLTVVALAAYIKPDEDQAGSGSPLYHFAVHDALDGLRGRKNQPQQGVPCKDCGKIHAAPQRVGGANTAAQSSVKVGDLYWCDNCQTYHKQKSVDGPVVVPYLPESSLDNTDPLFQGALGIPGTPLTDPVPAPAPVPQP